MRIFVDIDGTLTTKQRCRSVWRDELRHDVIDCVKEWQAAGHEVVLWTGSTDYAEKAKELLGIDCIAAVGKPDIIVDNQRNKWGKRLNKRTITPEEFLTMTIPKK